MRIIHFDVLSLDFRPIKTSRIGDIWLVMRKIPAGSRSSPVTWNTIDHLTAIYSLKSIFVNKASQEIHLKFLSFCYVQLNDVIYRPSGDFVLRCNALPHEYANFFKANERSDRKNFFSYRTKAFVFFNQSDTANYIRWPDNDEIAPNMERWVFADPKTQNPHCVSSSWCVLSSNFRWETSTSNLLEYYTIMALIFYLVC